MLVFGYSCSKDTDLIADYVVETPNTVLANAIVTTLSNNPIVIDPLKDEVVVVPENVIITEVTPPTLGTAVVNPDNTITYTPDEDKSGTDEFDYTATVTNPDNSTTTATGNVTVNVGEVDKQQPDDTTGYVNFSTFGAVGDGKADDTKALQAALDSDSTLIATEGAVFKISSTLKINQGFNHSIKWNGATIITDSALNPMINIDKRSSNGGETVMSNLTINGNAKATRGAHIYSRVNFTDIDITDFYQTTTSSPAGIMVQVYNNSNAHGEWIFDNVNITKTVGASNGKITDSWGASNSMLLYWKELPSVATNISIKNGSFNNSWGEDSGLLYVLDQTSGKQIGNSLGSVTVDNMDFFDSERRAIKGFSGNLTFTNSKFTDPLPSNPNIQEGTKSGLVVVGSDGYNIKMDNCEFVSRGYDGRVIAALANDLEIKNSIFKGGATLALTLAVGDLLICNNTFEGGNIYAYNISSSAYKGTISIGTNNTGPEGYIKLDNSKWSSTSCN